MVLNTLCVDGGSRLFDSNGKQKAVRDIVTLTTFGGESLAL